jgi:trk system potassium uptake protein TrkH
MKQVSFFSPARIILIYFLILILGGAFLLKLPISTTRPISFIDAVFTSTSAVTVTGLIVLDTSRDFTFFGKLVILLLIQVGGLGYMTFSAFFLLTLKQRLRYKERLILAETLNYPGVYGVLNFFKKVLLYAFGIEFTGTFLLYLIFYQRMKDLQKAFWFALFHSISAFNNAGFSLFPDSFISYANSISLNLIVTTLIILGGLGFFVLEDIENYLRKRKKVLSVHTKLVFLITGFLIVAGFLWMFLIEFHLNPVFKHLSLKSKILISYFTSVTTRTAGFTTVDLSKMSESTLFFLDILMFIGGSPGGTAGGVKTITAIVVFLTIWSYIRGKSEVLFCKRAIPEDTIKKSLVILSVGFLLETMAALILSRLENTPVVYTMFETVSAFSTVGLSVGNGGVLSYCANFETFGKILIILSMLIGRVGFLSFLIAVAGRAKESKIKHIEAKILL